MANRFVFCPASRHRYRRVLHQPEKVVGTGCIKGGDPRVRIAYLISRYPAVSHSFIRREIAAVEAEGITIARFSIRPADASLLPDRRDQSEVAKTRFLLKGNCVALILSALLAVASHPMRSLKAIRIAFGGCGWRPLDFVRRTAYFVEAAFLARRMRLERLEHIHAHFGTNPAAVARLASILSNLPYSFTIHGPDEFDSPLQIDLAGKVRDSAFCVAISDFGRSQVMRWSAFQDWEKIKVIRCGVDDSFINTLEKCDTPSAPSLCAVARLSGQKGIPLLLEAASELKRRGRNFCLTLVGDGEMRKEIEEIIIAHDLTGIVKLAGWADSDAVKKHIRASRAMVLPSFAEGLPVVIMEALALGRPVIVTAIAGTPELVDSTCGWLVYAGSVAGLVSAMEEALDATSEQLGRMGQVGRKRVLRHHDSRLNGQKMAAMFRSRGTNAA